MKTVKTALVFLILLSVPVIARAAFFYRGVYDPPAVTRPAISDIAIPPTSEFIEFVDSFEASEAVVVFDLAHDNNFKEAELNVLLGRLAARGTHPEYLRPGDPLDEKLRRAQGLVVISPKIMFTNEEVRAVKHFVESGGNLLLVTDPTRYEIAYDDMGFPVDRISDVAVMNTLSAAFGLVFEDDYLYNMTDNAGTFRDIILTDFADMPLLEGLEEVIFFAAHSISTNGESVIETDEGTRSSLTGRQGGLVVAALTTSGHVLGLSDLTFLTEPFSSLANNAQLASNITEFLVSGRRDYTLADFPYFFGDQVDLRYAGQEAIGGEVLSQAGLLQSGFDAAGKKLLPRTSDSIDNDVLFIGLYDGTDYVQELLTTRQISITLEPATETEEQAEDKEHDPSDDSGIPTVKKTPEAETTFEPTDFLSVTSESDLEPDVAPGEWSEAALKGIIWVPDLGEFSMDSVTLLSLGEEPGHRAMIVLAASESALAQALDVLARGDLTQCLTGDRFALCPSDSTSLDLTEPLDDFYLPPSDSEIPTTSPLEFIEPVDPPLLPD